MRIRDALESDAEAIAAVTGRPPDVIADMIHDRSVRVAVEDEDAGVDGSGDGRDTDRRDGRETSGSRTSAGDAGDPDGTVDGFVAFDVRSETVHVTGFGGSKPAIGRLFEEPKRFADREGMDVEVVVAGDDEDRIEAVEAAGFVSVGAGPRFDGRETVRFRLEVDDHGENG